MEDASTTRILILFAHPALQKSRVNRTLIRGLHDLPGVTFHDLYEAYPVFDIDVPHEQALCAAHDLIVFQHPLFWFSAPALLKEWLDLVLEHGWAFGHEGTALHGKQLLSVISTGGSEEAYQPEGFNRITMAELLAPCARIAQLCGMEFLPPYAVHGTHLMTQEQIEAHAVEYRRTLEALRDGRLDLDAARAHSRLNADIDALIAEGGP